MFDHAKWISPAVDYGRACPVFRKQFSAKAVKKATLAVTALGIYAAKLNGERVGDYVFAPGWTQYEKRLQYQQYDVTEMIREQNEISVTVGEGWMRGEINANFRPERDGTDQFKCAVPAGVLAELTLEYADGSREIIATDENWETAKTGILFSSIYNGETYEAGVVPTDFVAAKPIDPTLLPGFELIPQQGEKIIEQDRIAAAKLIITPKGEKVIDFGQNLTGYVEFTVNAKKGDVIRFHHGEVLDKNGNFYNENYREADAKFEYICAEGEQTYHAQFAFYGFRYICIESWPGEPKAENFTAIVVCSDIRRIGKLECSAPLVQKLFDNIFWGQRCNFLDVPTDCPQRDERLGWTGDAQVFVRTASYNYDVEKFFEKWLCDVEASRGRYGMPDNVVPRVWNGETASAAWGDVCCIVPWTIYQTYGNAELLRRNFNLMKDWVDAIGKVTHDEFLWTGCEHFGDWLGLDAEPGSYTGSSRKDFIASAFYIYSTSLVIKAGMELGEDVGRFEKLYEKVLAKFRETFTDYRTQTEHVLALHFGITTEPEKTAASLADMIRKNGTALATGFVGTPYLLHVLSSNGYTELAYDLFVREKFPSWLNQVKLGATTMWEHWDNIREDGEFWSKDMNSFNHYAYGSVADWIYEVACGIKPAKPGFAEAVIAPKPDARLGRLFASIDPRHGQISSGWTYANGQFRYEIETPVKTAITIDGKTKVVNAGKYIFYSK